MDVFPAEFCVASESQEFIGILVQICVFSKQIQFADAHKNSTFSIYLTHTSDQILGQLSFLLHLYMTLIAEIKVQIF